MTGGVELWTIGHSNHAFEHFLGLLQQYRIDVLADVRSQPYAKYAAHFSQAPLRQLLADKDLRYVFLGRELGGRPPELEMYDADGYVLYGDLAETQRFAQGLERLLEGAARCRVAMMCSEENPTDCHRRLLVARALLEGDPSTSVTHIRGDGSSIDELKLRHDTDGFNQLALFKEAAPWRSAQSASPSTARKASLAF